MITVLGQDLQPGSIVFRGGGNSSGGSEHRVGRVIKVNDEKKTVYVNWIYNIWSDEITSHDVKSTVPSYQVVVLDKKTYERLDLIRDAGVDFRRSNPRPGMSDFNMSDYDQRLRALNDANARWNQEHHNYINHVLVENGHEPMP